MFTRRASMALEYTTPIGKLRESYTYDQPGGMTMKRLSPTTGVGQEPIWKLESTYEYDEEGRAKKLTYPNGGQTYTYGYDNMGRQNGISHKDIPGGPDISDGGIVYTAHGQMQSLTAVDGADVYTQGFTYNNRMQMITMTANKNGAPVANMTYSYPLANAGRLSSTLNNLTGEHTTYAYDDLMRLTMATASISGTVQWRQTLSYDGFGNMFKIVGTGLASSTSYDSTLDSAKNQMPIGAYQANGNPVGGAFDVAGMKTSGVYQLGYAPDNKRVVRRIY